MEAQRRPLYLAAADAVISNTGTLAQTLAAAQEALDEIFDSYRAKHQSGALV